ncbi:MAG: LCP family protein, partial [Hamadaea sp.]|nr:LCP family protein [Hamadaea sp.]
TARRTAAPGRGDAGRGGTVRGAYRPPFWARWLVVLGAIVALVGFGGMAVAKFYVGQLTKGIETTTAALDTGDAEAQQRAAARLPTGAIDMLLLGLDTRTGWNETGQLSRADTIVVLHISASRDQAYLISIPRDTVARIPADEEMEFRGATTRINSAYAYGSAQGRGWSGGARLTAAAVTELTGLEFDGVAVIDFSGFKRVVEALGRVRMCVERDTWSSHYSIGDEGAPVYDSGRDGSRPGPKPWIHQAGCRAMEGWEALDFARQRYGLPNGDYDRQKHQQQLLRAMAGRATSAGVLTSPKRVAEVLAAAGQSLKLDTRGVPVADFLFGLKSLAAADLVAIKTNGGTFASAGKGGGETITYATQKMFAAASKDRLGQFLMEHPEFIATDPVVQPSKRPRKRS